MPVRSLSTSLLGESDESTAEVPPGRDRPGASNDGTQSEFDQMFGQRSDQTSLDCFEAQLLGLISSDLAPSDLYHGACRAWRLARTSADLNRYQIKLDQELGPMQADSAIRAGAIR